MVWVKISTLLRLVGLHRHGYNNNHRNQRWLSWQRSPASKFCWSIPDLLPLWTLWLYHNIKLLPPLLLTNKRHLLKWLMLLLLLGATVSTILHIARNEKSIENKEQVQINNSRPEALLSLIMPMFVKMTAGTLEHFLTKWFLFLFFLSFL